MKKKHNYTSYFWKHKFKIVIITILGLFSTIASLYTTFVSSTLVGELSSFDPTNLFYYAKVLLGVEAVMLLANFFSERLSLRVKSSVVRSLHWDLGAILAQASPESVDNNNITKLSERLREGPKFANSVEGIFLELFSLVKGLVALGISFYLSWQMGTLLVIAIVVILITQFVTIKKMIKSQQIAATASDKCKQLNLEILDGFSAIKSQNLIPGLKKFFSINLENEFNLNLKAEKISIVHSYLSRQILSFFNIVFILLGGWLAINGLITFTNFVTLFMYKSYVGGLVESILKIAKNKACLSTTVIRMNELFNYKIISKETFGYNKLYNPSGNIVIKNLSVEYGNIKVLDNLSIDIPVGFIGIIGSSGCGKSTLMRVLARQQSPVSGQVLLDGLDLWSLDQKSYSSAIKMAPQTPYIFSLSVKENMLLANPDAGVREIWDALEECDAKSLVEERGGLDAVISSQDLSGGEKQRLALARLGVNGSKIVLLDESTSALDNISQRNVLKTIRDVADRGHTMILVAHRISALKNADLIIHLEDGKVLEKGTFSELYSTSEKFRRMADAD